MSKDEIIDYEVNSSFWASLIGWKWGQELSGRYFAWKVRRKYERYVAGKLREEWVRTKHLKIVIEGWVNGRYRAKYGGS